MCRGAIPHGGFWRLQPAVMVFCRPCIMQRCGWAGFLTGASIWTLWLSTVSTRDAHVGSWVYNMHNGCALCMRSLHASLVLLAYISMGADQLACTSDVYTTQSMLPSFCSMCRSICDIVVAVQHSKTAHSNTQLCCKACTVQLCAGVGRTWPWVGWDCAASRCAARRTAQL